MSSIKELAQKYEPQIIENRRYLHRHPELGFNLENSAKYVMEQLKAIGVESRLCGKITEEEYEKYAGIGFPNIDKVTGVVATIGSGEPCILLRADFDALPMPETSGVEFASENEGIMHSCGHDSHAAMLLGAARILKEKESELKGTVKLMFQPGEELGYGSKLMINDGLLENPKVDAAFAIHIMPDVEVNTANYPRGICSSSFDTWMLNIKGQGGHSSMPELCIDPVMIASQLYTQLNLLVTREAAPKDLVAFTIGKLAAGTASNIIPDTAEMQIGLRLQNIELRNKLAPRVEEFIDHVVTMWRGTYSFNHYFTPSTFSDKDFIDDVLPAIEDIVGKENAREVPAMAGTEDFGYVSSEVPGMFMILGTGKPGNYPVHNPNMVQDESAFKTGAAIYASVAMRWLDLHGNK